MVAINVDVLAVTVTECCLWQWKVLLRLRGRMGVRMRLVILGNAMTTRDRKWLLLVVLMV